MEVKEIIELMKAMSENGMTGFELEEGDWKLSMKREKIPTITTSIQYYTGGFS